MQDLVVGIVVGVFRQHKQLYTSVTGRYMDRNDSKEVQKVNLPGFRTRCSS